MGALLPKDYNIRRALIEDASYIAKVHIQSWQETYQGIVDDDYLLSLDHNRFFKGRKNILNKGEGGHFVVTHYNYIVGFCDAGPLNDQYQPSYGRGEVYAIYLLQKHHGQGLGRAMLKMARLWLQQNQSSHFFICSIKENKKACHFYQSQGGKLLEKEFFCTIGDRDYQEVIYYFD